MKISDLIAEYLIFKGVNIVFGYQGGSITHMIDSFDKKGVEYIQTYNEQGAGLAADAYARTSDVGLGVAIGTNGPGATNLITSIANAYCDSIPVLFFTGQVHSFAIKKNADIRQESFQEIDIISIVKPITKYAVTITDPSEVIMEIAKAIGVALSDRKGPVLIDIPVDIQGMDIEVGFERDYFELAEASAAKDIFTCEECSLNDLVEVSSLIKESKFPVILVGGGARLSGAVDEIRQLVQNTRLPVVCSLMGLDVMEHNNSSFIGFIGIYGNRYANIAIQNADLILVLGSRLDGRQTGKRKDLFATKAKIVHVDIDSNELKHYIQEDVSIRSDLKDFVGKLSAQLEKDKYKVSDEWLEQIALWKNSFRDDLEFDSRIEENPNGCVKLITSYLQNDTVITADVGQNQMWIAQSARVDGSNIRILNSGGLGTMGFSLPAAIGAFFSNKYIKIVSFMGDGGLQMNIQELGVIGDKQLPIDVVVFNNQSLGLIRDIHEKYYDCRYVGSVSGFTMPNLEYVAKAYDFEYVKILKLEDISDVWKKSANKPRLIEILFHKNTYVRPELLGNDGLEYQKPYVY